MEDFEDQRRRQSEDDRRWGRGRGRGRQKIRAERSSSPSNRGERGKKRGSRGRSYAREHADSSARQESPKEKRHWKIFLGYKRLQELKEKEPNEILMTLLARHESFVDALNDKGHDDNMISFILTCCAKACQCCSMSQKILQFLKTLENSTFFKETLMRYLMCIQPSCTADMDTCQNTIIDIFQICFEFKSRNPHALLSLWGMIRILCEACDRIRRKCDVLNNNLEATYIKWKDSESETLQAILLDSKQDGASNSDDKRQPPESFRQIPVFPVSADIHVEDLPFLRRNKTFGGYQNLNHYLDIQFRLLREDFIAPLRDGVHKYVEALNTSGKTKRLQDVKIYTDVQIISPVCQNIGLCQKVRFSCHGFNRIRWESSKRLMFGSLVCISADNFETFVFATVANRKELNRGLVDLYFENGSLESKCMCKEATFVMAETTAYFEAYRHVLDGLKSMDEGDLPFTEYIVYCTPEIKPPAYMQKTETPVKFNLRPLVDQNFEQENLRTEQSVPCARGKEDPCKVNSFLERASNILVLDPGKWPEAELFGMDYSQYRAFQMALSKEFVIIQGPPGTGKTFVGLKIVKALLCNKSKWISTLQNEDKSPLLVVCYTNHALDQFLEGIIEFSHKDVLRVGGKVTSEIMKNFMLSHKRDILRNNRTVPEIIHKEKMANKDKLFQLKGFIDEITHRMVNAKLDILHEECLEGIIGKRLFESLIRGYEYLLNKEEYETSHEKSIEGPVICDWLGYAQLSFSMFSNQTVTPISTQPMPDADHAFLANNEDLLDVLDVADLDIQQGEVEFSDEESGNATMSNAVAPEVTYMMYNLGLGTGKTTVAFKVSGDVESKIKNDEQSYSKEESDDSRWQVIGSGKRKILLEITQELKSKDTMSLVEISDISDVWELNQKDRWRLYRYWVNEYCSILQSKIDENTKDFQSLCKENCEIKMQEDREIIKQSSVVGMTTTCAARYQSVLKEIGPRIIVVEEAAEVLEAHVITALSKHCQHLILIGDHQQLKPTPTVYKLAREYNLELSLFERMIKNKLDYRCLEFQHRMRPEISKIMQIIYPQLQNHDAVMHYENVKGICKNVFFINHSEEETSDAESKSHSNVHEAKYISELCKYLLLQGYHPSRITVLTMYSGQLYTMKQNMPKNVFGGVKLTVVDNFQGEENDFVLLSLVRSNDEDRIGFLSTENRICVALSRAKIGFYVIGNFEMLARKSHLWAKIVSLARKEDFFGNGLSLYCQNHPTDGAIIAVTANDFYLAPEGGCLKFCDFRLPCGHTCTKACHVIDAMHVEFRCLKPCLKTVCNLGHSCPGYCSDPCKKCQIPVPKVIPKCRHTQNVPCSVDPGNYICTEKCEHILKCGHMCQRLCGESHTEECGEFITKTWSVCGHSLELKCFRKNEKCLVPCKVTLDCSHICRGTCGECFQHRFHKACKKPCNKLLVCEHRCKDTCDSCMPCKHKCENKCRHSKCRKLCDEPCDPCREECDWACVHFSCTKMCFELCNRPRCNKKCEKLLKCKHQCIGVCGEPCPKYCRICDQDFFAKLKNSNNGEHLYVELEDCEHLFEMSELDKLMCGASFSQKLKPIKFKGCPICKAPIRNTRRYGDIIKQTQIDIDVIKKKMFVEERQLSDLYQSFEYTKLEAQDKVEIGKNIKALGKSPTQMNLSVIVNQIRFLSCLQSIKNNYETYFPLVVKAVSFIKDIHDFVLEKRKCYTKHEILDIKLEMEKLENLYLLLKIKEENAKRNRKFDNSVEVHIATAEQYLTDGLRFDITRKVFVTKLLEAVKELRIVPSYVSTVPRETLNLFQPPLPKKDHWDKCSKGHVCYNNDVSEIRRYTCPECVQSFSQYEHYSLRKAVTGK